MRFPFTLPADRPFDAAGFGTNAVEHLIVVPEFPAFDTKVRLLKHTQVAAGQTANAMVALKRLGLRTAYAGRFGSDAEGRFGFQAIEDEGVDLEFAELVEAARTPVAFVFIDARNGERTIMWDRDERSRYEEGEAPIPLAASCRVLHLDGHDATAAARMARAAREHGAIVSAHVKDLYDGVPKLLPFIDVLVTSTELPHRLTGIADERASLVELKARYGCGVVGMTHGQRGAILFCEGEFVEAPAYDVPAGWLDTTGAGDAFPGGLLYGMLTGKDVETSVKLANESVVLTK